MSKNLHMAVNENILNRKGVRKAADIPAEVLQLLNEGKIATVNLTEWLAIDQRILLETFLRNVGQLEWLADMEAALQGQKKPSANNNAKTIGLAFGQLLKQESLNHLMKGHASDVVRCWYCWASSIQQDETAKLLAAMKPFAADPHFGIREVVIFASKERLALDLPTAIPILAQWTLEQDENVRRYAVEVLRPIGVWTKKIAAFQEDPTLGLPVLTPLKADPSKYVQNAVANWLNDASKSQAEWVKALCEDWSASSNEKATSYIIKRALRTINKSA